MSTEIWKDIKDYEGLYQISNLGRVKSLVGWNGRNYIKREKILKPSLSTTGYYKVELKANGQKKSKKVHRLVAEAFIPMVDEKPHINHKDGNPLNNTIENLEWCTQQENVQHAINTGLKKTIHIEPEELKKLYCDEMKTTQEIAELYETTRSTVIRIMKKHGIPRRKSHESKDIYHIDLVVLADEIKNGKTNAELASNYNCPSNLIAVRRYQMKKKGLI